MIAYFKRQSNLFMVLGAGLMVLILMPVYVSWLPKQEFYMRAFYLVLPAFFGVIIGRLFAAWWSNRKIREMDGLLYEKNDPEAFLRVFAPLAERVPHETIEYINGRLKLAYAYEGLGQYKNSLQMMDGLKPLELRLHALAAASLLANQQTRIHLLMEDTEKAGKGLSQLRELKTTAEGRVPVLAKNLEDCIHLADVWLGFLKGESCDIDYIKEERDLAKNAIHRKEMEDLISKMQESEEKAGKI